MILLLFLLPVGIIANEVICFHCYGNSSTTGQYCSIDNLCTGQSCYFHHKSSGEWASGCASESTSSATLQCQLDGINTKCTCNTDFCNEFDHANATLRAFWPNETPFNAFSFALPDTLDIYCMECGNVSIGGIKRFIPCTEDNLCRGHFCVTKRGDSPHSYCGTTWNGNSTARCFKNLAEEEQCVCSQQMCNAVLPPELRVTTTTVAATTTTVTPAKEPTKKCKNGMKFSPNAQAVAMGEKLKQIISGGFNSADKAVQEFNDGIDTHICNYSEDDK